MPRRKQHCPKKIGEEDAEEGASIAVKDASVNETQGEEDLGDPDQPVTTATTATTATVDATPKCISSPVNHETDIPGDEDDDDGDDDDDDDQRVAADGENDLKRATCSSSTSSSSRGKFKSRSNKSPVDGDNCNKIKPEVEEDEEGEPDLQIDFRVPTSSSSSNCKRSSSTSSSASSKQQKSSSTSTSASASSSTSTATSTSSSSATVVKGGGSKGSTVVMESEKKRKGIKVKRDDADDDDEDDRHGRTGDDGGSGGGDDDEDIELDDDEENPLKMSVDDDDEVGVPLDFSVKQTSNLVRTGKRKAADGEDGGGGGDAVGNGGGGGKKEKKKRSGESSSCSSSSFPLDLSVKRPSLLHHHHHHHSHHSAAAMAMAAVAAAAKKEAAMRLAASPSSSSPSPSSLSSSSTSFLASAAKFVTQSPPTKASSVSLVSSLRGPSSINGSDRPSKTSKSLQPPSTSGPTATTRSVNSHGRQNPWQTQWINRSSEQTRDVFTCVWCKESFRSLQEMTIHMKESPRCGMAGIQQAAAASASSSIGTSASNCNSQSNISPGTLNGTPAASGGSSTVKSLRQPLPSSSKEPASNAVLAKNTVTLPRKLVRGQDVWLGRGAEQTRQILKCMWCAQSFKTLEEMTEHMQVTQHYRKIVSQEQIISWRTPEAQVTQAQLNAVLTCKVCDEAFGSLKELSYHMVKNSHYKEHILRSITEGGHGRRRQARERRKKSLPVRKLLELERMEIQQPHHPQQQQQHHHHHHRSGLSNNGNSSSNNNNSSSAVSKLGDHRSSKSPQVENKQQASSASGQVDAGRGSTSESGLLCTCDECGEKVEARHLMSHLKSCKVRTSNSLLPSDGTDLGARSPSSTSSTGRPESSGPHSSQRSHSPPYCIAITTPGKKVVVKSESKIKLEDADGALLKDDASDSLDSPSAKGANVNATATTASSSSASLSALQSLIEKSFDLKVPGGKSGPGKCIGATGSGGSDFDQKKVNGSRCPSSNNHHSHHHQHNKESNSIKGAMNSCKSPLSASLSAVEKWMTLAKERDAPQNHLWSSSMSSSSSSWLCSDDEPDEAATLALAMKNKSIKSSSTSTSTANVIGGGDGDGDGASRASPASSIGTSSRPASVPRAQTASPNELNATSTGGKHVVNSSKLTSASSGKVKDEITNDTRNEEEERREEIEQLKRNANRCLDGGSPMSPSSGNNQNTTASSVVAAAAAAAASSSASLSALERLIEKSFDSKKKNAPTGFLQRLGIDEEVCPPWQPGLGLSLSALPFAGQLPFQPWLIPKHEGRSNTSSPSKGTKNGSLSSSPPV